MIGSRWPWSVVALLPAAWLLGCSAESGALVPALAAPPAASPAAPSTPPLVSLPRTEELAMTSKAGAAYRLLVSLPREYGSAAARYPVIFVLDPEYSFAIVRNIVEHLSDRGDLPATIVVGIGYPGGIEGDGWLRRYRIARTADYTPTKSAIGYPDGVQDVSGGGPGFLSFVADELVPFVDGRYRTTAGDRTLVGHSYGALFGAYALLTRPTVFSRAVLVSPSLWYDDHFIFRYEERQRAEQLDLPAHIFLGAGARENVESAGDIVSDVVRFHDVLEARHHPGVRVSHVVFDDETHNSVFPAAVGRGLRAVFAHGN